MSRVTRLATVPDTDGELAQSRFDPANATARGFMYQHGGGSGNQYVFTNLLAKQIGAVCRGINWRQPYTGLSTTTEDASLSQPSYTWGNDVAMSQLDDNYTYLTSFGGAKPGKVALIGGSMGHIVSWCWARLNPDKVAGVIGHNPACDLAYFRGTDAVHGPYYASINEAYGITTDAGFVSVNATRNPQVFAGGLDIPSLMALNDDDIVVNSPTQQLLFAATLDDVTLVRAAPGTSDPIPHFVTHITSTVIQRFFDRLDWS